MGRFYRHNADVYKRAVLAMRESFCAAHRIIGNAAPLELPPLSDTDEKWTEWMTAMPECTSCVTPDLCQQRREDN
jgi:hypothetical protein